MYISGRSCKNCGKYFTPERKHGVYCKESCRIASYKKRHGIPTPDFKLLNSAKIQSPLQIKLGQIRSKLLIALGEYHNFETKGKEWFEDEKRLEKTLAEKEKCIAEGRWFSEYELERARTWSLDASKKLIPIREGMRLKSVEIEKLRIEISQLETEVYIEENETSKKLHTAASVAETTFDTLDFDLTWKKLFGMPERGFTMLIYGEKFCGKSTFALKFADYLTKFGKVIYFSAEEGVKMTMQNKLKREGINNKNLKISDEQLPEAIMKVSKKFDFAIIDSLTTAGISADDLRNVKLKGSKTSYIGINHITTDGRAKGGTGQLHNPDIIVKIEGKGQVIIEKNRYSED